MPIGTPGQIAYEAYREHSREVSLVSGEEIPTWILLPRNIQEAWEAAADAVLMGVDI